MYIYLYLYRNMLPFLMENESPGKIFFTLLTVCSSCKGKFVVCPFVDEETNGSYPFANKLNGLKDYTD
jgi:hypothetical protein